jgi:solute carrier family 25 (mitochondrial carnitine/acylcarnitine transporter), member 20/29
MQTAPKGYYSGLIDCATKLYQAHGLSVYFRGLTPALFRAFPLHAIIFVTYEIVMGKLKNM